jgi:hypothetical protein
MRGAEVPSCANTRPATSLDWYARRLGLVVARLAISTCGPRSLGPVPAIGEHSEAIRAELANE